MRYGFPKIDKRLIGPAKTPLLSQMGGDMERQEKMEIQNIEALIIMSLQQVKEVLDEQKIDSFDSDTKIFGRKGVLDSMGLVSLITDLEERIEEEFGISLILADDRAMSQQKSPFRSVSSLAQYICMLIEEEKQNEGS